MNATKYFKEQRKPYVQLCPEPQTPKPYDRHQMSEPRGSKLIIIK